MKQSKQNFLSGHPIIAQLLSLIPREIFSEVVEQQSSDRYYKKLKSPSQPLINTSFTPNKTHHGRTEVLRAHEAPDRADRNGKTRSPKDLAKKLGLKDRMVYNLLDDLRFSIGKGICYCKEKRSYIFQKIDD